VARCIAWTSPGAGGGKRGPGDLKHPRRLFGTSGQLQLTKEKKKEGGGSGPTGRTTSSGLLCMEKKYECPEEIVLKPGTHTANARCYFMLCCAGANRKTRNPRGQNNGGEDKTPKIMIMERGRPQGAGKNTARPIRKDRRGPPGPGQPSVCRLGKKNLRGGRIRIAFAGLICPLLVWFTDGPDR